MAHPACCSHTESLTCPALPPAPRAQGTFTLISDYGYTFDYPTPTSVSGNFSLDDTELGTFSWPVSTECKDTILKLSPNYPVELAIGIIEQAYATPIALLTLPAASNIGFLADKGLGVERDAIGTWRLFNAVYEFVIGIPSADAMVSGRACTRAVHVSSAGANNRAIQASGAGGGTGAPAAAGC